MKDRERCERARGGGWKEDERNRVKRVDSFLRLEEETESENERETGHWDEARKRDRKREREREGARRGIFGQQSASLCWKIWNRLENPGPCRGVCAPQTSTQTPRLLVRSIARALVKLCEPTSPMVREEKRRGGCSSKTPGASNPVDKSGIENRCWILRTSSRVPLRRRINYDRSSASLNSLVD